MKKRFAGIMLVLSLIFTIAPVASAAQVTDVIDYTLVFQKKYQIFDSWSDYGSTVVYYKSISYINGYTNTPSSTSYSATSSPDSNGMVYRIKYVYYTTTTY